MASFQHIRPRYKLILFYNIKREKQDQYYRYMLSSFVPAIQKLGVYMHMVWHVAYGDYPRRKIEFVTESSDTLPACFSATNGMNWKASCGAMSTITKERSSITATVSSFDLR